MFACKPCSRELLYLEGVGRQVQKSVFECELAAKEILDLKEDQCHLYPVCAACYPARTVIGDLEPDWADAVIA